MAKEIVVWCDVHMAKGERVPSSSVTIGFDGQWRTLDLCEDCETVLGAVRALWDEHGVKVDAKVTGSARSRQNANGSPVDPHGLDRLLTSPRRGKQPEGARETPCPFCPLDYASEQAMRSHVNKKHGMPGASMVDVVGRVCPVCAAGGFDALSSHVIREHADMGLRSASQALRWAAASGDPHGVYEARCAVAKDVVPV